MHRSERSSSREKNDLTITTNPFTYQFSVKFINPMPPIPLLMNLTVSLRGANQQMTASEEVKGKAYSGRKVQKKTPTKTSQKTRICFLEMSKD